MARRRSSRFGLYRQGMCAHRWTVLDETDVCVNSSPDVSPYTELEVPAEDIIDDKVEVELLKYDPF